MYALKEKNTTAEKMERIVGRLWGCFSSLLEYSDNGNDFNMYKNTVLISEVMNVINIVIQDQGE